MNTNNTDYNMKKILTIILICIFGLASCTGPYEVHYGFGLDRQELRFKATNTASYFMVYGEGDWNLNLSKDAPWLTLDAMSGTGTTQVNVRLTQNEGVARDVAVIATYHDGSQVELIISQEASSSSDKAYSLSTSTLNLLKLERNLTIPATAKFIPECLGDLKYWVEYPSDEDKDWIENLQFNYSDVTLKVKENASASDRTAKVCWTFPVAHWETQDTLSMTVNQSSALPSIDLKESYNLDPASMDSLKIYPQINWDTALYNFDLSKFKVDEDVVCEYIQPGNYLALIAGRNTSGQTRRFSLEWSIMDNEVEVAKYTADLIQENFEVSISLKDSYTLDPEGVDSLRIVPEINWDPSVFDFDLSNFTVSEGVSAKYVKSGNYLAVVAEPNTSRQSRSFSLEWKVMDNGVEAAKATAVLVQGFYIPPVNLTPNGEYANCYVLSDVEENYYSVDACLISGDNVAGDIASAAVLWETSEGLITRCSYDAVTNKLYVGKAENAKGSAVIKLMAKDGTIRWSYHFWMTNTDAALPEITVGGITFMDRNVGATANTAPVNGESDAAGLYYQWGRKDPFPATTSMKTANGVISEVYPSGAVKLTVAQKGVSLQTAIENPSVFYWGNDNSGAEDWCSTQNDGYWNTAEKTYLDPCPYGYVVPDQTQLQTLINAYSKAATYGNMLKCDDGTENYISSAGWMRRKLHETSQYAHIGQHPHCWSTTAATVDDDCRGSVSTEKISGLKANARRWGGTVRCVKQTKTE